MYTKKGGQLPIFDIFICKCKVAKKKGDSYHISVIKSKEKIHLEKKGTVTDFIFVCRTQSSHENGRR